MDIWVRTLLSCALVADLPMVFWLNVNFMDFGCNGLRNFLITSLLGNDPFHFGHKLKGCFSKSFVNVNMC